MKDETKVKLAKFGTKFFLKFSGLELLGDAGELVAIVGKDFLPAATTNFLQALSDPLSEAISDKVGDLTGKFLTNGERSVNFHLARGICKVWEESLTASLPKKRAANPKYFLLPQDSFQDFNEELLFFISKFKEAQQEGNEDLLEKLFYDESKSETEFYNTFFQAVQDEGSAEDAYWETLEKTLIDWTKAGGKFREEWRNNFPDDFKRELKKFLFENLRIGLKEIFDENEQFRHAFQYSADLIVFDLLKKLPTEIKEEINNAQSENRHYYSQLQEKFSEVEHKIDRIPNTIARIFEAVFNPELLDEIKETNLVSKELLEIFKRNYYTEVYYSSPLLRQSVLGYLEKVSDRATELTKIYPDEFHSDEKKSIFFHTITQRVQVVKKEQLDAFKATARGNEQEKLYGIDERIIYDQRNFDDAIMAKETVECVEIYEWNNETRKEFRRKVILGDPGFGKSWLLNFEADKLAQEAIAVLKSAPETPEETAKVLKEIKVPIFLRIADIAKQAKGNKEIVLTIAESASFSEKVNDGRNSLTSFLKETIHRQENAILLLDALDEVSEDAKEGLTRREIASKISDFAKEYKNNSILLTSRKVNYESVDLHDPNRKTLSDDTLEIVAFDETQIKNYASAWFGKDSPTTQSFLDLIENQTQTAGLSQNPLMLSLMCRLFYQEQIKPETERNFPNSRCRIYEECLKGLLRDWKDKRTGHPVSDAALGDAIRKLGRTAFYLFDRGLEQFSELDVQAAFCEKDDVYAINDDESAKSLAFLAECKNDGIIVETSKDNKSGMMQYRFIHLTFQEYLTASYLAGQKDWKEFIFEKRKRGLRNEVLFNPNWQHTLRLLGGKLSANDAKDYIKMLLDLNGENGENDILFRPFILANFVANEAGIKDSEDIGAFLLNRTCHFFLRSPDFQVAKTFFPALQAWQDTLTRKCLGFLDDLKTSNLAFWTDKLDPADVEDGAKVVIYLLSHLSKSSNEKIPRFLNILENEKYKDVHRFVIYTIANFKEIPSNFGDKILSLLVDARFQDHCLFVPSLLNRLINIDLALGKKIFTAYIEQKNPLYKRKIIEGWQNLEEFPSEIAEKIVQGISEKKATPFPEEHIWALSFLKEIPTEFGNDVIKLIIDEKTSPRIKEILAGAFRLKEISIDQGNEILLLIDSQQTNPHVRSCLACALSFVHRIPDQLGSRIFQLLQNNNIPHLDRIWLAEALGKVTNKSPELVTQIVDLICDVRFAPEVRKELAENLNVQEISMELSEQMFRLLQQKQIHNHIRQCLAVSFRSTNWIPFSLGQQILSHLVGETDQEVTFALIETINNLTESSDEFCKQLFKRFVDADSLNSRFLLAIVLRKHVLLNPYLQSTTTNKILTTLTVLLVENRLSQFNYLLDYEDQKLDIQQMEELKTICLDIVAILSWRLMRMVSIRDESHLN